MVEGAVAGSSTGEGGYGERGGGAAQPYPTHQKTEIQTPRVFAPPEYLRDLRDLFAPREWRPPTRRAPMVMIGRLLAEASVAQSARQVHQQPRQMRMRS